MNTFGKIFHRLAGPGVAVGIGLLLLGACGPTRPQDQLPWLTPDEAYEDQTARTGMDGGAFVTFGLKIRDPKDVCREEGDYIPATHAINNGRLQTLPSGAVIYVRNEDNLQRRSVWVAADKLYFIDESGCKAHDIYAFDGYYAGADGSWDQQVARLTTDTRAVNGSKYREEGKPGGSYLQFNMAADGSGSVQRANPASKVKEEYKTDPFGRGAYALEKTGDPQVRAHLVLLPDGRTALLSQAGQTQKFILE